MPDVEQIFISAVSKGLRTYRQIVTEVVAAQDYQPVVQEYFPTPSNDLTDEIRRTVFRCHALIALVGPHYGVCSKVPGKNGLPLSYSQYEIEYARRHQRPCVVFLYEGPSDLLDAEPAELQRSQQDFIAELKRDPKLNCNPFVDVGQLALALAKFRWRRWLDGR